ncbi:MAG: hypothetical protein ACRDJ2_03750 [Actinomycetota bacterium]
MSEVTRVALFSKLLWPAGAPGIRPLLVFESYDESVWNLPGLVASAENDVSAFMAHGFELLAADQLEHAKVDTKIRLAAAWAALITLCIYADFLSLYRPGQLDEIPVRGATVGA